jgi:hypothetical protein
MPDNTTQKIDPRDYPYAVQRAGKDGIALYEALAKRLTAAGLTTDEVSQWIALNFDASYAAMTKDEKKAKQP